MILFFLYIDYMKYLKKFNENISKYSSYEDVISVLEEALYLLEVSFNYNVDVSYKFEDFVCIITIKPIGWNLQKINNFDLDKKEYLDLDLKKIEKMFQPYLDSVQNFENMIKPQHPFRKTFYSNDNIMRIYVCFNLFCLKCENQKLVCPSCEGNKTILCGCDNGMEACGECFGTIDNDNDDNCYSCHGSGEKECEWCSGYGRTDCSNCDGQGYIKCKHQWL